MCFSIIDFLNKLESLKVATENVDLTVQKIIAIEIELSNYYLLLGDILKRSHMIHCDCLLTAFSLCPEWNNYYAIIELVKGKRELSNIYGTKYDPLYTILRTSIYNDILTVIMKPRMKNLQWQNGCQETLNQCKLLANHPDEKINFLKRSLKKYPTMNEINKNLIRDLVFETEYHNLLTAKAMHEKNQSAVLFDEINNLDVIGFVPIFRYN